MTDSKGQLSISLVDKTGTITVQVKGLVVDFRPPGLSERLAIFASNAEGIGSGDVSEINFKAMVRAVADIVKRIHGWEEHLPIDVLEGIENPLDFYAIVQELMKQIKLRDTTGKNSERSSAQSEPPASSPTVESASPEVVGPPDFSADRPTTAP